MREPFRFEGRHLLLALAFLGSLAAVVSHVSTEAAGPPNPLSVVVANPPSAPIPTQAQGTTSVAPTTGAVFRVQPGVEPVTLVSNSNLDPGVGTFRRVFPNGEETTPSSCRKGRSWSSRTSPGMGTCPAERPTA